MNDIFHRTRTNTPKIYGETQKTLSCQSNPEEEEQSWKYKPLRCNTILQSNGNQNSMVLAQNKLIDQ